MDVTDAIQQINTKMGQGGNSLENSVSSNKSLNFAEGATIQKPTMTGTLTRLPYTFKFKGTTGLGGAENQFFQIDSDVKDYGVSDQVFEGPYLVAFITPGCDTDTYYDCALIDENKDLEPIVNTYEPAVISDNLVGINRPVFTVRLKNNGTGNQYVDNWLDVSLYTKQRFVHPEDGMIIFGKDKLYIGFHARNTRRLDYDVEVIVGEAFTSYYQLTDEQKRLMQRVI